MRKVTKMGEKNPHGMKSVKGEHICVQVGSGNLTSWFATSNIRKDFEDYNVIRWAYVSDLIKTIRYE